MNVMPASTTATTPRIVMAFWPGREAVDEPPALFLQAIDVDDRHQTCILMISLNASTARSRTATVSSVVSDASVAAIV